jgi:hypothetical protein
MKYEIWRTGFSITGNSEPACFIGFSYGDTFEEACKNYQDEITGKKLDLDAHYPFPAIWGCRLYDNEADARKSFG